MEIKKIYRENKNKVIVALVFKPFKFSNNHYYSGL